MHYSEKKKKKKKKKKIKNASLKGDYKKLGLGKFLASLGPLVAKVEPA